MKEGLKDGAKDLLFEIGTEELPARYIPAALKAYKEFLEKSFNGLGLAFLRVETFGTPRRLTLVVRGLMDVQPDRRVEVRGPRVAAAYDKEGRPTKTLEGFAGAQGVDVKDIKRAASPRGEVVMAVKEVKGGKTITLIPEILEKTLSRDVFPKSMRWADHDITFARPVHRILALYGAQVVDVNFGHLRSADFTVGRRFVSAGGSSGVEGRGLKVDSVQGYFRALKENGVVVDPEERKKIISEGLKEKAREAGGEVMADTALLEEVAYLVEYPVVVLGSFEEAFLKLPREVIINAMRSHQRYFSVVDKKGSLLPYFLTVANTPAPDMEKIIKGNEKVLRARLGDAGFYFERDIKVPLVERARELKGVIFQAGLGTSYEKVLRFTALALYLGEKAGLSEKLQEGEGPEDFLSDSFNPSKYDAANIDPLLYSKFVLGRASVLSKGDLVSGVVGEFPDLQGIMGGIYAERGGEAPGVASAISEHYRPASAGGRLPETTAGALISVADKLDTIAGFFAIGKVPTGAVDPYALRRQALGVIAVILDKKFRVSLDEAVKKAVALIHGQLTGNKLKGDAAAVEDAILNFFKERLRNNLLASDLPFDSIDAVLSTRWYILPDAVARIKALEEFKAHPACKDLVVAFKRVSNILKGFNAGGAVPQEGLFQDPDEKELFKAEQEVSPAIKSFWAKGDYKSVFETLASIKDRIDSFFDHVMVMVEDEKLRRNRLLLLHGVRNLYYEIADLSKLAIS